MPLSLPSMYAYCCAYQLWTLVRSDRMTVDVIWLTFDACSETPTVSLWVIRWCSRVPLYSSGSQLWMTVLSAVDHCRLATRVRSQLSARIIRSICSWPISRKLVTQKLGVCSASSVLVRRSWSRRHFSRAGDTGMMLETPGHALSAG